MAALAFVKSTPRPGVRSFRLVSFAYNHAQSPLLVHPFLLPSLRYPLSTPGLAVSIASVSLLLPCCHLPLCSPTLSLPPLRCVSLSLSLSLPLRSLCKLTSGSIVSTCRCLRSPPLGYLTALLPSLLNHSVSCPYRRMRVPPRLSLSLSVSLSCLLFPHPTSLPSCGAIPTRAFRLRPKVFSLPPLTTAHFSSSPSPWRVTTQHCSSDSGF